MRCFGYDTPRVRDLELVEELVVAAVALEQAVFRAHMDPHLGASREACCILP